MEYITNVAGFAIAVVIIVGALFIVSVLSIVMVKLIWTNTREETWHKLFSCFEREEPRPCPHYGRHADEGGEETTVPTTLREAHLL